MHRVNNEQKAYTSPPASFISGNNYFQFPLSQQLSSSYQPNFKKLSAKRKLYNSQPIRFKQIFDFKQFQNIIGDSCHSKNFNCILCQNKYPNEQIFELCKCKHKYCQHCLIQYVSYKINAMEDIRCPDQFCPQKINNQGEIYIKLPEQLKKKYRKTQLWRQTIANPDLKLCPQQLCQGQIDVKNMPLQCTICKKYFCSQCMMQKHQGNCDKIYEMTHKQWRRCPSCRMFIAKSEGCNHIRCRCSNEFCFVCLQKWNTSHYKCMQKIQMYYFSMDEIKHPLVLVSIMIALFPFIVIAVILALIICFVIMIPVGVIMGIGYCLMKYYYLLCLVILLLPIGALIGAISIPFIFMIQKAIPQFIHHFRRYKITLEQLLLKLNQNSSN